MSAEFTQFIKILGRGKKGSRPLTAEEAELAMSMMLNGQVAPEQEGAFWMLIRIREETVDETVGFTKAVRRYLKSTWPTDIQIDLDWPAYAGKRNELPWFLLSALALANAGYKVVMHGHSFTDEDRIYVDQFVQALGLPTVSETEPKSLRKMLLQHNFVYMPLKAISKSLANMMDLKLTLGLRSPVNTVVRMMNPFSAKHSVHGVFHKGYDDLHAQACLILEDPSVLIFRGGNGEAEVNPEREVTLAKVQSGELHWEQWNRIEQDHTRNKFNLSVERFLAEWTSEQTDPFGEKAVLQTLASVLGLMLKSDDHEECLQSAQKIWAQRHKDFFSYQHAG